MIDNNEFVELSKNFTDALNKEVNIATYSPLTLAFLGDSVFDLLVREMLVKCANMPVSKLNEIKVKIVNAKSQSDAVKRISDKLTEEELSVYKRGRNAKVNSVPKHSKVSDYHNATGLESLFGYLYLQKKSDRINEIFSMIISD